MEITKMHNGAFVELNFDELEIYPAWQLTQLAHIRINNKNKWTDCWLGAINKNGRVRFVLSHEKGYPSEQKGIAVRRLTTSWLSVNVPKIGEEGEE